MSLIIYLLKVNIAIIILYGFYLLFFQKDTFFRFKRLVLLSIFFISLAYPLGSFTLQWMQNKEIVEVINQGIASFSLPEVLITPDTILTEKSNSLQIIIGIYLTVSFVLFVWMVFQIFQIIKKIHQSKKIDLFGISVNILKGTEAPYSFFQWIILDPEMQNEHDLKEIIFHEETHVRQYHSIDVILCELMCVICWFNPFIWLMKREVRMNLEFLADYSVISSGCNTEHYQLHLLRLSYHKAIAKLTNNFNVSPLKKRIQMMNKRKTPWIGLAKYILFLPIISVLLLVNCSQGQDPAETSSKASSGNGENTKIETVTIDEDPNVFVHCEVMPEYPGGQYELMKFLNENIKYPEIAQKKGVQGTVVLRFIVRKNGNVEDVRVVRSLEPDCDKEAIRVINQMPDWTPGKQKGENVDVYFTIPVRFLLAS